MSVGSKDRVETNRRTDAILIAIPCRLTWWLTTFTVGLRRLRNKVEHVNICFILVLSVQIVGVRSIETENRYLTLFIFYFVDNKLICDVFMTCLMHACIR